ncbi:ferredoxin reductase [Tsukamurella sp. 8F]|uniref:ferredoxin reductase n=1 Tax=unclassified Tsukamurella TaxID=2633480 RepID=UPI0023B8AD8F|nr:MULTISPECIES: ferredoxin reductase [unclassified Tsukamurella]MDF0529052.1 ferredoxin reductase [Tsukamurella sp. 8J]MDF0587425.1 ferredoxin reductase [Tsukamurella sp. 8F]
MSNSLRGIRDWLEGPAKNVASQNPRANLVRGAVARLTTPLLPDDYLHLVNPLWSARELRGRIVDVRKETGDSVTLTIRTGWGFTPHYQPGQYIGIGVLLGGRWTWRSYSLTSVPEHQDGRAPSEVSITVKAMAEGFLSSHLVNGVAPGTVVRLQAPAGDFTLPNPLPEKILFLTAGSGITPVMSMLRTLDRRGIPADTDIIAVHSAPDADSALFREELAEFDASHAGVTVRMRYTRETGRLTPGNIGEAVPDWAERETWICGPGAFLSDMEQAWQAKGIFDRLHQERFTVERADVSASGGEVHFAKSDKTIEVDGATTLLEAGEAQGVQMPFGCRMGICQTCVVQLTEGQTRDLRSGDLHVEGERIQTCIAVAVGDCTLDV